MIHRLGVVFAVRHIGRQKRLEADKYVADDVRQGFTGYIYDGETGLDFAKARMYSKTLGRFTACDPINISKEHPQNPQKWNLYVYVLNNPLNLTDPDGMKPKKVIDLFILIDQPKEGKAQWTQLRKNLLKQGVILNIFRVGDGTATSKNFIKSITTAGRNTIFIGHSAGDGQTEKTHKGIGIGFQNTNDGFLTDLLTTKDRAKVIGREATTLDGISAKAANIAVFSCNFGAAFDNLGSSNNTNFFYVNNGTLGGSGTDANNQAGYRIVQAFASGAKPQEALQAAREGFDSFRGAQDNDGDEVEHRVLKPVSRP